MIHTPMVPLPIRRTARRMGVGRALLRIRSLRALTMRGAIDMVLARSQYLGRILNAPPIPAGHGQLEVHMLLHHQRILEGIWALYSFVHFARLPCRIYVHDDGSLTATDEAHLQTVLPGTRVISRAEADELVVPTLMDRRLPTALRFRNSLIFALKLIDPFFFGDRSSFFLLDSDVLFFRRPDELLDDVVDGAPDVPLNRYSPDNGTRYCIGPDALHELLGQECIAAFNPGVVRTNRTVLDLSSIERYLQRQEFWGSSSRPHYYGELTLWAMQLTTAGAQPLPSSYAITPPLDGPVPVSGHFCGGGYPATWFYSRGLPRLAKEFGIDASHV